MQFVVQRRWWLLPLKNVMQFSFPLEFCLCVGRLLSFVTWLDLTGGQWGKVRNVVYKQGRTKDKTQAFKVEQNRGFLYITTWHKSFFWGIIIIQNMRLSNNWNGCNRTRESFFFLFLALTDMHTPLVALFERSFARFTHEPTCEKKLFPTRGPVFRRNLLTQTSTVQPSINVSNLRKSVLIGERVGRQNFIGLPNTVICTM